MKTKCCFVIAVMLLTFTCPAQNQWIAKSNFGGAKRGGAVGFFIKSVNKGYIGTGAHGTNGEVDFWEYDPDYNFWTQKANFAGSGRAYAVGFSIGNKGYIGTGTTPSSTLNDFWEYDPDSNMWRQKANFAGSPRKKAVGFSIGNKGYIGVGEGISGFRDFWEYNPDSNTWTQKAIFGGLFRSGAVGFSIGSKGYIGNGQSPKNDFWEYNPDSDTWTQKTSCPLANFGSVGFSIGDKGYVGTGYVSQFFYEYNPITDIWTKKANFTKSIYNGVGFASCNKGYLGTGMAPYGSGGIQFYSDFGEYSPSIIQPAISASFTNFCQGGCIDFSDKSLISLNNWKWTFPKGNPATSTLQNPTHICFDTLGVYPVTLSTNIGCGDLISLPLYLTVKTELVPNVGPDVTLCSGKSTQLNASGGYTYLWNPITGLSDPTIPNPWATPNDSTIYTVTVGGGFCASKTDAVKVNVTPNPAPPIITLTFAILLSSSYPLGNQWYMGGSILSKEIYQTLTLTQPGIYSVKYTDYNKCSTMSEPFRIFKVGMDESSDLDNYFKLYPNPSTNGFFTLNSMKPEQEIQLEIYNQLGKRCYSKQIKESSTEINLTGETKGIYLLYIHSEGKTFCKKLIIQ